MGVVVKDAIACVEMGEGTPHRNAGIVSKKGGMTTPSNRDSCIWARLYRVTFVLTAIAPCGMAVALALLVYPRGGAAVFYGWPSSGAMTELAGLAVSVGVVATLVLTCLKKPRSLFVAVVFGVIFRIFLAVALLPGLVPYSDFAQAWEIANGTASEQTVLYKSFFPEWCNYIAFTRLLVDGFGLTYGGLVLVSVAVGLVVVGEVYLLARIVTGQREMGLLSAAIYALMPSQIIYALIPAPDILSMVFLLAAACLLAWQLSRPLDAGGRFHGGGALGRFAHRRRIVLQADWVGACNRLRYGARNQVFCLLI